MNKDLIPSLHPNGSFTRVKNAKLTDFFILEINLKRSYCGECSSSSSSEREKAEEVMHAYI